MGRLSQRGEAPNARVWSGTLLLAVALAACAGRPEGTVHVVRPGENLYRIGLHYGVSVAAIARANDIRDERQLEVGTRLWIPRPKRSAIEQPLVPPDRLRTLAQNDALENGALRFAWPVNGRLTSRFGWRRSRMHEGIDIAARSGTPVHAAESGRVIYASRLGGYGNVIVLRHGRRYETVYAHNRRFHVSKGARIRRGDVIAEVGATGNASAPHLHFEVRRDDDPRDPLLFLP
jgi:murein DD-endopeptidase MepM/ murein hydrolase activator NlpD